MSEFKQLFAFLVKKAIDIEDCSRITESKIDAMHKNIEGDSVKSKECQELFCLYSNFQRSLNNIFVYLNDLDQINVIREHQPDSFEKKEYDRFTDRLAKEITCQKILFNQEHPLFGFALFHKKLIQIYTKIGDFEMCSYLKNTLLEQESIQR